MWIRRSKSSCFSRRSLPFTPEQPEDAEARRALATPEAGGRAAPRTPARPRENCGGKAGKGLLQMVQHGNSHFLVTSSVPIWWDGRVWRERFPSRSKAALEKETSVVDAVIAGQGLRKPSAPGGMLMAPEIHVDTLPVQGRCLEVRPLEVTGAYRGSPRDRLCRWLGLPPHEVTEKWPWRSREGGPPPDSI